jgi:hypothetical protein
MVNAVVIIISCHVISNAIAGHVSAAVEAGFVGRAWLSRGPTFQNAYGGGLPLPVAAPAGSPMLKKSKFLIDYSQHTIRLACCSTQIACQQRFLR